MRTPSRHWRLRVGRKVVSAAEKSKNEFANKGGGKWLKMQHGILGGASSPGKGGNLGPIYGTAKYTLAGSTNVMNKGWRITNIEIHRIKHSPSLRGQYC